MKKNDMKKKISEPTKSTGLQQFGNTPIGVASGTTSFQRSVSYQTHVSSSFSSQTTSRKTETKTFSSGSLGSFPTTNTSTSRWVEYKSPATKGQPSSSVSSLPVGYQNQRTIFELDAKPFNPSALLNQPSVRGGATVGYQSPFRRPETVYSSLPRRPSEVPATNTPSITSAQTNRDPRIPTYETSGKKRGKAIIINNVSFAKKDDERKGSEVDEKRISDLFKKMGFEVKVYRNLKKSEMNDKLNKYKSDRSLEKVDISVVVLMSHGHNINNGKIVPGGYTQIMGTDGEGFPIEEVLGKFDSANCSALKGKPKIFVFQCCRGEQQEDIHVDAVPIKNVIKKHADMLIAYSTLPGFFSLRDAVKGSWYIQSICDVFERHAKEFDVETLLKIVDEQLSKKHPQYQQTSTYESRGFKRCYLNPPS